MPTEIKRAIRTADAWAADQAAMEALYGVGGYHTSISAFIAWAQTNYPNLVTSDVQLTAVCYDDWPSGLNDEIVISGFTTDATRYVKITVAEGHRHNGTLRSGFWVWHTNTGKRIFTISTRWTRLEWMDTYAQLLLNTACYYCDTNGDDTTFLNCIGETGGSGTAAYVFASVAASDLKIHNCMAVGGKYGIWWGNNSRGQLYNCIVKGAGTAGIHATATGTATIDIRNTIAYNNAVNFEDLGTRWASTCTNNASTEASGAPGVNPIHSLPSTHFVDAANNDFHLLEASSLRDAGVNLYSDLTIDIDGDPRPSAGAWSVGYDQYIVETIMPTLTDPTAAYITPTTATPRVTVTYP